jgi:plastocyanin
VPAGTTVLWSNQDVAPHTVTTDTTDSGLIDPGGSFSMVVDATISYVCTLHPSMQASIDVT